MGLGSRSKKNARGRLAWLRSVRKKKAEAMVGYEYDMSRNLTAEIDPLGNRTEYAHDELGRILTATYPLPLEVVQFSCRVFFGFFENPL